MPKILQVEWERKTEKPLIIAAIVFFAAYAWPILDTSLPAWSAPPLLVVTYVVWAMFGTDYAIRLALAKRRLRFVRANWIDLVILAVPMLRPLRPPEVSIESFGDALWWAATTVTTVGYGDQVPTTSEGKIVAVGLMVTGIALVGVVTGALVSWFVERVAEAAPAENRVADQLADVSAELRALREEIRTLRDH